MFFYDVEVTGNPLLVRDFLATMQENPDPHLAVIRKVRDLKISHVSSVGYFGYAYVNKSCVLARWQMQLTEPIKAAKQEIRGSRIFPRQGMLMTTEPVMAPKSMSVAC